MSNNTISHDIELAIIAGILQKGDSISRLVDICSVDDFSWTSYRWAYETFVSLYEKELTIDYLTFIEELSLKDKLLGFKIPSSELIGTDAIDYIRNTQVNLDALESYAIQCHDYNVKRKAKKISANVDEWIKAGASGIEIVSKLESELGKVSAYAGVSTKTITDSNTVLNDAISETEYAAKGNQKYIETGIKALDEKTGGFFPQQLITIAGRQGQGKSALAKTIALNVGVLNKWKKKVGIFTLEMPNAQYMQRMVSALCGIPAQRLKRGVIYENEWTKYKQAIETLRNSNNLYFDDTSQLTSPQLHNKISKMMELGVELIILDQMALMAGGSGRGEQEYARIDKLSYQFKGYAREFDVPFVNIQQMSRSIENYQRKDKEPKSSDLSQAGEGAPDLIIMIQHEEIAKKIISSKLWLVKQRDGEVCPIDVKFDGVRTHFMDIPAEEANANKPEFVQSELPQ